MNRKLQESVNDLHDNCAILYHIVSSQLYILKTAKTQLGETNKQPRLVSLINELEIARKKIIKLRMSNSYPTLRLGTDTIFHKLRASAQPTGAIVTSLDWQSPSFAHSLTSQAGRQTGKIQGTINDYKRDHHLDEKEYEKLFVKEYIDARFKFNIHAYLTNSGQAAFTTILTYLQSEGKLNGTILIGENTYFQYKQILVRIFSCNCHAQLVSASKEIPKQVRDDKLQHLIEVNEHNTKEIIDSIKKWRPCAVFIDSLSNAATIPVPDIPLIYHHLSRNVNSETYLIIDNTCLGPTFQPFNLPGGSGKVRTIMWESLNKYHQFGMDRVTAGIVVVKGHDAGGIFEYRKHAGTNITDASVYALPLPNRKFLEARLQRHQRNAMLLVDYLRANITGTKMVEAIVYPEENLPFRGSFFNVKLKQRLRNRKTYERIIFKVLDVAKKRKVNIVAGTSFGLSTTRIYLTSLWSKYGEPFLRVSVGTEDRIQIERIKEVIYSALFN